MLRYMALRDVLSLYCALLSFKVIHSERITALFPVTCSILICSVHSSSIVTTEAVCVCVAVVWRFHAPMHSTKMLRLWFRSATANRDRQKTTEKKNGVQIEINSQHRCFRSVLRHSTDTHSAIQSENSMWAFAWFVCVCVYCVVLSQQIRYYKF